MLVGDDPAKPAGAVPTDEETAKLFGTLIAHSRTYVIERDKITHKIDVSWNRNWTGGDQVRFYKFEGVQRQILKDIPRPPDTATRDD